MLTNKEIIENLITLKTVSKFENDGINVDFARDIDKTALLSTYHAVIDTFIHASENGRPTDEEYQSLIASGLERFDNYNLDTEDREKLCGYFEDILDAIDLESSGGAINTWLYGFDVE